MSNKQAHDDIYGTPSPSAGGTPRKIKEVDDRASNEKEEKSAKPKQGTAAVGSIAH